VQEINLVVSPYDVRQGGFSGGGINMVTRSGANDYHGSLFYFRSTTCSSARTSARIASIASTISSAAGRSSSTTASRILPTRSSRSTPAEMTRSARSEKQARLIYYSGHVQR